MRIEILGLLVLGLASACSPLTAHRTSTRVGHMAPSPWTGATAEQGEVWVSGGTEIAGSVGLDDTQVALETGAFLLPEPGDPGLQISPWRSFGQVRWGAHDIVELGLRGAIDHPGEEMPTRLGVFDPGDSPSWMIAPTVGLTGRISRQFDFVGRIEPRLTFMPYTRYSLIDPDDEGSWAAGDGREFYQVGERGVTRRLLWNGSASFVWNAPDDWGDVHTGFAVGEQITNEGFTGSKPDPAVRGVPAFMWTLGGSVQVQDVRIGTQLWMHPFDENEHGLAMPHLGAQVLLEFRLRRPTSLARVGGGGGT